MKSDINEKINKSFTAQFSGAVLLFYFGLSLAIANFAKAESVFCEEAFQLHENARQLPTRADFVVRGDRIDGNVWKYFVPPENHDFGATMRGSSGIRYRFAEVTVDGSTRLIKPLRFKNELDFVSRSSLIQGMLSAEKFAGPKLYRYGYLTDQGLALHEPKNRDAAPIRFPYIEIEKIEFSDQSWTLKKALQNITLRDLRKLWDQMGDHGGEVSRRIADLMISTVERGADPFTDFDVLIDGVTVRPIDTEEWKPVNSTRESLERAILELLQISTIGNDRHGLELMANFFRRLNASHRISKAEIQQTVGYFAKIWKSSTSTQFQRLAERSFPSSLSIDSEQSATYLAEQVWR